MQKRFCEQCGAALSPDARFCAACGIAVDAASTAPPLRKPQSTVQRFRPAAGLVLGLLAVALVLLGGAGFWLLGSVDLGSGPEPDTRPLTAPARDPQEIIAGKAAPTAGDNRPLVSAVDSVLPETTVEQALPPIPVTDDPVDVAALKAAVEAANARDVDALYAAGPGERDTALRDAVEVAITALGHGLYRHHVVDGHGDLPSAQQEMRSFLSGIEYRGLGLSDDLIESGVTRVEP